MKNSSISQFIGKQLSRLKAGQSYYMIIVSTITALGILDIAFEGISTWLFIILFPFVLFCAYLIGYFMDKSNVVTMDQQKTIEMAHRYLTKADYKMNEFRIVLIKVLFKWLESTQKGEPINYEEFDDEYYRARTASQRLDEMQFLREQYFKMNKEARNAHRKGLRRIITIVKQV